MADPKDTEDELEAGDPEDQEDEPVEDNEPDPDAAEEGQDEDPAPAHEDDPDVSREILQVDQPRRSRAQERIRASRDEVRRERERAADLERQLASERANRSSTQAADEQRREEQLLASMDESQKTQYLMAKAIKENQVRQQRLEQQIFDSNDRSNFMARTSRDTRAQRLADQVENTYNQLRSQLPPTATPISREVIYYALLGQQIANASPKRGVKQREAGQRRIDNARGSGASARSDVGGRRTGKTLEDRLADVPI